MTETLLEKLFEHNNWANQQLIAACAQLSKEHLDAEPEAAAYGTIRQTLIHLVTAQVGYVRLLTRPVEERRRAKINLVLSELVDAAGRSGQDLLELIRERDPQAASARIETTDGFWVEPWVVLVQAIDHAAEHREQVCAQLSALGVKPPALDGWSYGESIGGLVPKTE